MPWEPSRSRRRKEGEQRSGKKTRRMKTRECLELWSGLNKEVVTSGDDVAERQTGPQVPLPFGFDNREVTQQEHLGQVGAAAPGGEDEDREGERECVCDRERQENLESTQILKGRNS